ncbi:MAG: thiamine-phosphate kinase [Flavobacteriales bacterium]
MFEDKKQSFTQISELGEFGLIERLTKNAKKNAPNTTKGVGDDAAVLENTNEQTLVSTDLLIEGVHFDLTYVPLRHLGYKSVVVNLSDICAMNAKPTQVTVSIAVSNRFPVDALDEFYEGVHLACNHYGVDLIGGDTSSSKTGFMISVTAIGQAKAKDISYRHMAEDKDLLVVSGDLGAAYLGLQLLEREKEVFKVNPEMQPELDENHAYMLERQLKPEARLDIIKLLEELQVTPKAMIDVSDGLSSEIIHLCKASDVGCKVYEEKIPIDPMVINLANDFQIHQTTIAMNGGEDYELLFTISMADFDKIKGNPNLTVIGHITDKSEGLSMITRTNESIELKAQGWNQMKPKPE